jgi:hypothetical protein
MSRASPNLAFHRLDALLRAVGIHGPDLSTDFASRTSTRSLSLRDLLLLIVTAGACYGACMGTFAYEPVRSMLMLYSAMKIPILIVLTTLVCLPAFFVLNTAAGVRDDFGKALRAVLSAQGAFTVTLAGLAPVVMFIYTTGVNHRFALLTNGAIFLGATIVAQVVLWARYRRLIAANRVHVAMMASWMLLYGFVAVQMAWMLRPFVGDPAKPVTFLREEPFTNAYIAMLKLVLQN